MMGGQVCKEEFRLRNFFYHFEDETAFYRCQWKWPRCVYTSLRLLLAAYTLFGFIFELMDYYAKARIRDKPITFNMTTLPPDADVSDPDPDFDDWDSRRPWCVYFTMWTYMVLMTHMILAALLTVMFNGGDDTNDTELHSVTERAGVEDSYLDFPRREEYEPLIRADEILPTPRPKLTTRSSSLISSEYRQTPLAWYFKLSWFLSNVISACAPIVTTIFFTALYEGGPVGIYDTNIHILNTVFVVLDHLISARPVRVLHWPAPVFLGLCYGLFSYIFWRFDHVNHVVYENVLDWNYPAQAAVNMLILTFVGIAGVCGVFSFSVYLSLYNTVLYGGGLKKEGNDRGGESLRSRVEMMLEWERINEK
ncbi:protein rolling stone-like [Elysia marginata]|uniref:Protein rolling stone-like n=1 Tax=Elysia marginata TaxID=1093978 RepID=A0AAV4GAC0_9GAST|nr:protein rolling stone-like [Elysia marginata]